MYYRLVSGKELLWPLTREALAQAYQRGEIDGHTPIREGGSKKWRPLKDLAVFAFVAGQAGAAKPAPEPSPSPRVVSHPPEWGKAEPADDEPPRPAPASMDWKQLLEERERRKGESAICKTCSAEVSQKALFCPQCGSLLRARALWRAGVAATLAIGLAVYSAVSLGLPGAPVVTQNTSEPNDAPPTAPLPFRIARQWSIAGIGVGLDIAVNPKAGREQVLALGKFLLAYYRKTPLVDINIWGDFQSAQLGYEARPGNSAILAKVVVNANTGMRQAIWLGKDEPEFPGYAVDVYQGENGVLRLENRREERQARVP